VPPGGIVAMTVRGLRAAAGPRECYSACGMTHCGGLAVAAGTEAKLSGCSLPDDWYLVVADGCDSEIVSSSRLSTLSIDCEAVAGSAEEHVMYSAAEAWRGGKRTWRIVHDAQKVSRHIECSGDPPAKYAVALDEAKMQQDVEDAGAKEVDFYFDIPLRVAKSIVGFKHDEDCPGVDYDCFTVIERAGSLHEHSWWQWWKW
jgi:hypothetical protein